MLPESTANSAPVKLQRVIGLPLLVLYGLGTTIGAGIYVLVGTTAGIAGVYAPSAFLLSAVVMAFSAASFAEFSGRIPKSAGEAAFVSAGFNRRWLTVLTGFVIILSATIAAAAIAIGCAGYIAVLLPVSQNIIVPIIVGAMGILAIWGIQQSVMIAGILTIIEIVGLGVIIVAGFAAHPEITADLPLVFPAPGNVEALSVVFGASLIAFFAFIGFDDVVNLVEETRAPKSVMPWAILITLVTVTILYYLVSFVAVRVLPISDLAESKAPIRLLFQHLTDLSPLTITLVAIVATINGVIIQIIMASRVLYGLSNSGHLPSIFARINATTKTPIYASVLITLAVILVASLGTLDTLAELTSQLILFVFLLVNVSLVRVKLADPTPPDGFAVPIVVPMVGALLCLALVLIPLVI